MRKTRAQVEDFVSPAEHLEASGALTGEKGQVTPACDPLPFRIWEWECSPGL